MNTLSYMGLSFTGAVLIAGWAAGGCAFCLGDTRGELFVTGQLIDATTNAPFAPARIIGTIRRKGEQTGREAAILDDRPNLPIRVDDIGDFLLIFSTDLVPVCGPVFGPRYPPPVFPRPDQIELVVTLEGCEQTVVIDINEATVVDPTAPDDVLEFRNPISVPPCEGESNVQP